MIVHQVGYCTLFSYIWELLGPVINLIGRLGYIAYPVDRIWKYLKKYSHAKFILLLPLFIQVQACISRLHSLLFYSPASCE